MDRVTRLGRRFMAEMRKAGSPATETPLIHWFKFPAGLSEDALVIQGAAKFGSLFVDGFGEGLLWDARGQDTDFLRVSSFNLLQAARMRVSKTEFISCPSCGRTLFDLQEVTGKIRQRTGHLPGVRIAVMGCIVNGPGEMADADVNYDCVKKEFLPLMQ